MVDVKGGKITASQLVDDYVNVTGDTMTGNLVMSGTGINVPFISGVQSINGTSCTVSGLSSIYLVNTINEFSIDGTLADDSNSALPSEKAVKTYVDSQVSAENLWDRTGTILTPHTINDNISGVNSFTMSGASISSDGVGTFGGATSGQSTIASGFVVNDAGGNTATDDLRVETDNYPSAFVVDASADQIETGVVTLAKDKIAFTQTDLNEYIDSLADGYLDYRVTIAHRFGDGTNYAEIKTDGEINLHGTARVKKQIWMQAEAIKAPLANPATFADLGISGAWQFPDNLTRYIICKLPLVTDIDTSVDAEVHFGWSSPTTSANCRWQVEYLVRAEDEDMTVAAEATLTQTEGSSATANGLNISTFIIPAAALAAADSCLLLRIARLGADAADTLGDVANLSGLCLNYVSNTLGEATE